MGSITSYEMATVNDFKRLLEKKPEILLEVTKGKAPDVRQACLALALQALVEVTKTKLEVMNLLNAIAAEMVEAKKEQQSA